ncbi:non-heme iron oxygenase ferredoxin subunit [Pseudomonas asiatica]|uniref:non-heme iron oxygenase ferredoxin subunit n=1 Tax=Pseudomonas asiatica TaxID=2219225 RepID=UPI0018A9E8B0|nr:non-heme iron oxygenase ferredoxin subunit [Pseudomonas asiatica]MBF8803509.1 non-heme iron oxygenase ferredoxin subunit [Pseudomonas asiatica]
MSEKIYLCKSSDLGEGEMRQVCPPGIKNEFAVYKVNEKIYVTDDLCTHGMVSLAGGDLEGTTVYCPLHGGAFDICTGKATEKPCTTKLKTYEVVVESGDVFCMYGS